MNNYEDLANAIILQAAKDYRKALRTLSQYPNDSYARSQRKSIEQFFRSDYYDALSNLNPEALIEQLTKEVVV
jgi:hypothetical protein